MAQRYCNRRMLASSFHSQMDLHHTLFWGCAVVTGVAELLILRAAFFPVMDGGPDARMPATNRGVEVLWGVLPAFALAAVFAYAWHALW